MEKNTITEEISKRLRNKIELIDRAIEEGGIITPDMKIKVMVLADSPTVTTGFGHVCKEILNLLYETGYYDFEIVGINHDGSPHDLPYKIYPAFNGLMNDAAYRDIYGKQRFLDLLGEGRADIVYIIQDTFVIEQHKFGQRIAETNLELPADKKFASIFYFPIDSTPKQSWIDNSVILAHHPVAYTKYAYEEVLKLYTVGEDSLLDEKTKSLNAEKLDALKNSMNIIYHGVNLDNFFPQDAETKLSLREQFWADKKDKFVFINVNRNQPRKDLFRTMLAFKKLLDKRRAEGKDDVYLYMHCNIYDSGLNLIDMSKQIQLVEGEEFGFPRPEMFNVAQAFPVSVVNDLYNAADAMVTTTLGEGWGLSLSESMAVKIPIIAPDHTSVPEIIGKTKEGIAERGLIVKTDNCFVQRDDNSRVRPLTDVDDLVEKMYFAVENRGKMAGMTERAYQWVKELEWKGELVGGKWKALFASVYTHNLTIRAVEVDKQLAHEISGMKLGVNDQCPVCHVKYKNCRHYVATKQ